MNQDVPFQTMREQDKLVFSLKDVRRERMHGDSMKSKSLVPDQKSWMKPAPMTSRSVVAPSGSEFTEVSYVQDQCDRLYAEVTDLRTELIQLRKRRVDLEQELLDRDKREVMYNQLHRPNERQTTWPKQKHIITEDILRLRKEKEETVKDRKKLKETVSDESIEALRQAVERQRKPLMEMRKKAKQNEFEISDLQHRIRTLMASSVFEDIQKQREQIAELKAQLDGQVGVYEQLKAEFDYLNNQTFALSEEEIDETEEVQALIKELEAAKSRKVQTAREFRRVQDEQEQEEILENLNKKQKKRNLRSIFVGLFDETVSEESIELMFEKFGEITNIVVTTIERQEGVYFCAYLKFDSHEQAKRAIHGMNRVMFREKPLIVCWNDEFPMPPSSKSRGTYFRRTFSRNLAPREPAKPKEDKHAKTMPVSEPSMVIERSATGSPRRRHRKRRDLAVEVVSMIDFDEKAKENENGVLCDESEQEIGDTVPISVKKMEVDGSDGMKVDEPTEVLALLSSDSNMESGAENGNERENNVENPLNPALIAEIIEPVVEEKSENDKKEQLDTKMIAEITEPVVEEKSENDKKEQLNANLVAEVIEIAVNDQKVESEKNVNEEEPIVSKEEKELEQIEHIDLNVLTSTIEEVITEETNTNEANLVKTREIDANEEVCEKAEEPLSINSVSVKLASCLSRETRRAIDPEIQLVNDDTENNADLNENNEEEQTVKTDQVEDAEQQDKKSTSSDEEVVVSEQPELNQSESSSHPCDVAPPAPERDAEAVQEEEAINEPEDKSFSELHVNENEPEDVRNVRLVVPDVSLMDVSLESSIL